MELARSCSGRALRFLACTLACTTLLFTACDNETPTPDGIATPRLTTSATTPGTASRTITPAGTTPPATTPTAAIPAAPGAPAGYASSCAAGYPWGRRVSTPFVCIEEPDPGTVVPTGQSLTVHGYAGGSFENNVVVQLRDPDGNVVVSEPLTYAAPELGTPGAWQLQMPVPVGISAGPARISAYFTSPRDGGVVALASVELRVAPGRRP